MLFYLINDYCLCLKKCFNNKFIRVQLYNLKAKQLLCNNYKCNLHKTS